MRKSSDKGRRALLVLIAVITIFILTVSCAGCSLFVSMFTGQSGATQNATSSDSSKDNTSQSGSSGGNGGVDLNEIEKQTEPTPGSEPGSGETEPPKTEEPKTEPGETETPKTEDTTETEELAHVSITSSLTYDKASDADMTISATHEGMSLAGSGLMGAGLTAARYNIKSNTVGASSFTLKKEYLSTLDVGHYDLYYVVQDSKAVYYEPFVLEVTNTSCHPTDVKINYDIDCKGAYSDVYITWECDCADRHTVAFDGSGTTVSAGVREYKVTGSVDKTAAHTAQVRCFGKPATEVNVTKAKPAKSVVDGGYLAATFSFMGKVADRYVEDFDEMVFAYQYLAYEGSDTDLEVALGPNVLAETGSNEELRAYLGRVNGELVVPWGLEIGFSGGSIATISVNNVVGGNSISSGYTSSIAYDATGFASHYEDQGGSRTELPIDAKPGVSVRNTKELLAVVEAGYRPITEGALTTLYNKARAVCSRYLSDEMSDVEKLHVIYDYLAGEIVYDDSALQLFTLLGGIGTASLDTAKALIDTTLGDPKCKFSDSMRAKISEARNTATFNDASQNAAIAGNLYKMLYNDYLQKLNAFSIEGVFNDGTAVCEGISYAFMLLARIEGIECYQVSGKAVQNGSRVNHAWNKVVLDDTCYCVDATWGSFHAEGMEDRYVTHRYFLLDEASFYASHKEEVSQDVEGISRLATGNYGYYKSTAIDEEDHTLYVADKDDLEAVANYYADAESLYLEMQLDPGYSAGADIMTALSKAYPGFTAYSNATSDNGVYFVFVTKD